MVVGLEEGGADGALVDGDGVGFDDVDGWDDTVGMLEGPAEGCVVGVLVMGASVGLVVDGVGVGTDDVVGAEDAVG